MYTKRLDSLKSIARAALLLSLLIRLPFAFGEEVRLDTTLDRIHAPTFLFPTPTNGGVLFTEPDGKTVRLMYRVYPEGKVEEGHANEGAGPEIYQDISTDGGLTWKLREKVFESEFHSNSDVAYMHPDTKELYWTYRIGKDKNPYLMRSSEQRTKWNPEKKVKLPFSLRYDTGSFTWLRDKDEKTGHRRLIFASHDWNTAGAVTWWSDDDGSTWQGPSNDCNSPTPPRGRWGNATNTGHIIELQDGRLWMLTRNSHDHLWEYFSDDRGETWTKGRPSRFVGVFSGFRLFRIPDGRIMLVWLNNMPRMTRLYHNTVRDTLHAAISDDDGKTWRGFREVALGRKRNALVFSPMYIYDVSTHHPKFTVTKDNKAIVFTGQDNKYWYHESEHRIGVIFDLDWLYDTSRSTDFSNAYDDLSVHKLSNRKWKDTTYYSRTLGATLIEHPTRAFKKVLHLGREKCNWVHNEQDGANWNFPAGKQGTLTTRILLRKGCKGALISLTDVLYGPSDNAGDSTAMYRLAIGADGKVAGTETVLAPDVWYEVRLEWSGTDDRATDTCAVFINGKVLDQRLPLNKTSRNGISYVRFRSTAPEEDLAGWLVESIDADVSIPAKAALRGGAYEATILAQNPLEYWRCNATVHTNPNTDELPLITPRNAATLASSDSGATPGVSDSPALRPANGFNGFESTNTWFSYVDGGSSALILPADLDPGAKTTYMTAAQGSVSFWVRTDTALTGNEVLYYGSPHGFGSGPDGFGNGGSHAELHTHFHADGKLGGGIFHNNNVEVSSVGTYNDNQWHHVAFTWSDSETALYIDGGKLLDGETIIGAPSPHTFALSGRHVFGKTTMNALEYSGDADELAIWNKALTAEQVAAQYKAAISRPTADGNAPE